MNRQALDMLVRQPARVARWCGAALLTDELHGPWMRQMISGQGDMTLLAHRGSYKTTALSAAMAIMLCVYPKKNMLFLRKTDPDVIEIIRQVKMYLESDAMQYLTSQLWGQPVQLMRTDQFTVLTSVYCAPRGAVQLLGQGTHGSLTGKHADLIITDDIVNLQDRTSRLEREHTRAIYQELQNIRIPGGRIINTGTPWHPQDAVSLMPAPQRFDCYQTGLLSPQRLQELRQSMSPSLFAANYELKHIAEEDALFKTPPPLTQDASLLYDGFAHIDASYGGSDCTALTCGARRGDRAYLYGRLFSGHVEEHLPQILACCDALRCSPIFCETNGDKGYLARELRRQGALVRVYQESANKHVKIATHLRSWWPRITFLEGTDPAYISQILGYTAMARHDDAPDSAASLLRILDRT